MNCSGIVMRAGHYYNNLPEDNTPLEEDINKKLSSLYGINITSYLKEFYNNDFDDNLSLNLIGWDKGSFNNIEDYVDHILLLSKNTETDGAEGINGIAMLGFSVEPELALKVYQIQSIKGNEYKKILPPKWERGLVKSLISLGLDNGIKQIRITPADQSVYYEFPVDIDREDEKLMKSHQMRMKIRYDVTAKRSRFKFDENINAYNLRI